MDLWAGRTHEPNHKDATVKRYFYGTDAQLRRTCADFCDAYNFGGRAENVNGPPFEFVCKRWTTEPERIRLNPLQQMPGLNI